MISSRTITLFADPPQPDRSSASFILSIAAHGAVAGLLFLGLVRNPRISNPSLAGEYPVRLLDLHPAEAQLLRSSAGAIPYPGPASSALAASGGGSPRPAHRFPSRWPGAARRPRPCCSRT